MWVVVGADQGLPDGLGSRSGPTWAVLGVDQGVCGRSLEWISATRGSGSSGKAIWAGIWVEKWPKPKREGLSGQGIDKACGPEPEPSYAYFIRYLV